MNTLQGTPQDTADYAGPRSSLDDALTTAKFTESQARQFILLHDFATSESRRACDLEDKLRELQLLHKNCMRAANGQEPRDVVGDERSWNYSSLPQSKWPDEVKEIHNLRKRGAEMEQVQVVAKMTSNKYDDLMKRLSDAIDPTIDPKSGLLRSTRRAIARILERHRKANP
jgi:hypothetical protein